MNRGSGGRVADRYAVIDGFNEAPIHESGKCRGRPQRLLRASSFNEAPIHESGKSHQQFPLPHPAMPLQ